MKRDTELLLIVTKLAAVVVNLQITVKAIHAGAVGATSAEDAQERIRESDKLVDEMLDSLESYWAKVSGGSDNNG